SIFPFIDSSGMYLECKRAGPRKPCRVEELRGPAGQSGAVAPGGGVVTVFRAIYSVARRTSSRSRQSSDRHGKARGERHSRHSWSTRPCARFGFAAGRVLVVPNFFPDGR